MADASRKQLLNSLKDFLSSGNFSDLTITCGDEVYKAHKIIVCSRSAFFAKALHFPGKESEEATVDLPEDEPEIIDLLMHYLYEGEYDPFLLDNPQPSSLNIANKQTKVHSCKYGTANTWGYQDACNWSVCDHHYCGSQCSHNCVDFKCQVCMPELYRQSGEAEQLLTHSKMYEIGERYGVEGLKDLAKEKFRIACLQFWNTSSFAQATHHVFSSTITDDKGLRDIVCQALSSHMELIKKDVIAALLVEFNGLAYGLLKEKIDQGWK